jgi:hypothetical protein
MEKEYTIDRVSWHTNQKGNLETREETIERFRVLAEFLESQDLTEGPLLGSEGVVDDDFEIRTSNLTQLGRKVMKRGYDRWLSHIDRGGDPRETRILERALAACRSEDS